MNAWVLKVGTYMDLAEVQWIGRLAVEYCTQRPVSQFMEISLLPAGHSPNVL